MKLDQKKLRNVLGRFATGVTIITGRDITGEPFGFTATSFNTVSLDPPLILFSVRKGARSCDILSGANAYTVNVLGLHHAPLSDMFGRNTGLKERAIKLTEMCGHSMRGVSDALAVLHCRPYAAHGAGDHVVFIGEIQEILTSEGCRPLIFYNGQYHTTVPFNDLLPAQQEKKVV
ncbi:flavin reductase family protein [Komagataeibacter intermedius]|uniref:Nitrilotriacetate monooxygenase component B n=2 Tax=Komagataeibacter intermedius TaxID=66229 RepID=A0ABQ0PJX0_9PROT|nr:flavin reductase family protein [Komagataeibacter intermedius]KPH86835.1 putative flavin reductase [Komagataeibacter intermedius AF2]MCF3636870.1 flavin reductase family protein [Komagataeibacter intermedius]GAN87062.1 flavin mononucleotide (FMN) reductase [Komagataeibacter intermedius TF2]GBQ71731.1 nitrilotriacetate monooxygenase component B [Komagataeibacter intermedius NRIC 0521]